MVRPGRLWVVLRLSLGIGQIAWAVVAVMLFFTPGMSQWGYRAAAIATTCAVF